jgi:hypothetical protein
MARQTFPETPEQEAARINAASGDPNGITAAQVSQNRQINESITRAFGFGGGTTGGDFSIPADPLARIISASNEAISQVSSQGAGAIQSAGSELSKQRLDQLIADQSGAIGSGLNGVTSGVKNIIGNLGQDIEKFNSSIGEAAAGLQSAAGSTSALQADITSSLSKLTGGSLAGGVRSAAGALKKAAGSLNDILSLKRASNLPQGAEYLKNQESAIKLAPGSKEDWRVRINAPWQLFNSKMFDQLVETGGVVFPYLPNITVSTKAEYKREDLVHSNYPYYAYKNSTVDDIQITGEFSAETETDAAYWISATTFFKTATKMFFGQSPNAGNPPIICHLYGYGASIFDKIPIIITQFSVDLKDDVNYVKCNKFGTSTWVPVLSNITVTCVPIYSRETLRKFNLQSYAAGKMVGSDGVGYI